MPARREASHEERKLHQIRNREQRASSSYRDFGIRFAHIGPLRRNGAIALVVDSQQETSARPVIAFTNTQKSLPTEWVKRMGNADKVF